MNKTEIQKRITKNGVAISLDDFCWDEKSKTISTSASGYIFDFENMSGCTIKTGRDCTIKTGRDCTIDAGLNCTIDTGWDCTIDAGPSCTIKTELGCTIDAELGCTIKTGPYCTIDAVSNCTIKTVSNCTIDAGRDCTIDTGPYCTIKTGRDCTIKTVSNCTIDTGPYCTIDTGLNCTIKTWRDCTIKTVSNCTIDTGPGCVVVRRDNFEVITLTNPVNHICLCPRDIPGYVRDGIYSVTGKPAIIADGILSEIVSKKKSVYKVINYGESEISFLIEKDGVFSHGKTVKEAKESLMYKIKDRDTSIYNNHDLNTVLTTEEAIKMYRVITGACEEGAKYFVSNLPNVPKKLTVSKLIKLTEGQYNHKSLVDFFKDKTGEVSDEN
jgi:hypothetical protein